MHSNLSYSRILKHLRECSRRTLRIGEYAVNQITHLSESIIRSAGSVFSLCNSKRIG